MDYKHKIGIDVDGVLRNIDVPIMDIFKKLYPEAVKSEVISGYDFPNIDLPLRTKRECIFDVCPKDVFLNSLPYNEAVEDFPIIVEWAKKNKIKLVCTSHQKPHLIKLTYQWLAKWNFVFEELHFDKEKQCLPIDFLVDDSPKNYYKWMDRRMIGKFFMFDRDYNKDVNALVRINRLTDIINKF